MLDFVRTIAPLSWLAPPMADHPDESLDAAAQFDRIEALLEIGTRIVGCTIIELTSKGACIQLDDVEPPHGAFVGQQGLLRPVGGRQVSTVVRWFTENTLSLKFITAVSLGAFTARIDRYREVMQRPGRAEVDIRTRICQGERMASGTIVNISCGGALIRSPNHMRPGTSVMLQSDLTRPIGGYVRWQKDRLFGVMFNRLLSLESAEIISDEFDIHPIWLEEISECHRD